MGEYTAIWGAWGAAEGGYDMPSHANHTTHGARAVRATTHRKRTILLVVLALLVALMAAAGYCGVTLYRSASSARTHLGNAIAAVQAAREQASATGGAAGAGGALGGGLTDALPDIDYIAQQTAAAKQDVSGGLWSLAERLPMIGGDVRTARTAIDVIDDVARTTLPQLGETLTTLSQASLSDGDGRLTMEPIITAAESLTRINATVHTQAQTIADLPTARIGAVNDALSRGRTQMAALAQSVQQLTGMITMLPDFLGANGARTYMLLAQTNSEVRGAGGLVGMAGSFSADQGAITMGQFHADAEFPVGAAVSVPAEPGDAELYDGLFINQYIHNVSATPDFPRVAELARRFWQDAQFGGDCDGVMSLDPVALQAMIGVVGNVTLSDGRVLDGTNTAEFLLNGAYRELSVEAQDRYFGETAAQVVDRLFRDMTASRLMSLASTMLDMARQRHLYFWSFHEQDQPTLRQAGVSGEIGDDPAAPVTGVYVNQMRASKMDWYIRRTSTVTKTGDDAYHVAYTLTNELDGAQAAALPDYITYNAVGGTAQDRVILYAPGGGAISGIAASDGGAFTPVETASHMAYVNDVTLAPGTSVTIEYDVTVAAGSAPLRLDQTPTIGDPAITYRY